ncbi:MAG TPA: M1 family metallopeptidase [Acidimicrobiales bacterium]|nr:M1 family metallopeptidase [Acidimicrobiales bacterium]
MGRRRAREHPRRGAASGGRCGKPSVLRKVAAGLTAIALVAGCSKSSPPRASASNSSLSAQAPTPGASGAGDPYFPDLGNGGYDVDHYDLAIAVADPRLNQITGRATVTAKATQALSRFDFDLSGLTVQSVTVDGVAAANIAREGRELVITPVQPVEAQHTFTTVVDYSGGPEPRSTPAVPIAVGWVATGDGSFVISEPEGASTWYPVNDHPSDKATYTFHLDVPETATTVANGDLVSRTPNASGSVTWTYDAKQPMASYLAQVAIGDYQVMTAPGPDGVTIRNVFHSSVADGSPTFARTPDMISFFASLFGPFPFDIYGALVVNERTTFALETQTLSLFGDDVVSRGGDITVAHEVAHQWFGDNVSVESWKDVWLAEGFATYAEWLWTEHSGGAPVAQTAQATLDQIRNDVGSLPPPGDPGVEHMFGPSVYQRGALTLQALRLTVGDSVFFDILHTYASKYAGANATTADFISVAAQVSGRTDLQPLFDAWLYQTSLPDLPA